VRHTFAGKPEQLQELVLCQVNACSCVAWLHVISVLAGGDKHAWTCLLGTQRCRPIADIINIHGSLGAACNGAHVE